MVVVHAFGDLPDGQRAILAEMSVSTALSPMTHLPPFTYP